MDSARSALRPASLVGLLLAGCGGEEPVTARPPFAEAVVLFAPGPGAGFGRDELPGVVLGPPTGGPGPSLDVLSLGVGGGISLDFGPGRWVVDGPGPDLVVFENPFYIGGDPTRPFAELGLVSVSEDGADWYVFPCREGVDGRYPGCAGWTPTADLDFATAALDPETSGGDAFDLADVGAARIRFVRIEDLSAEGEAPSAGFDLDAVGAYHLSAP